MCRVSIIVSVFQTRPRIAAPPPAASQTTAATATLRWTAAILERHATAGIACNRRLRTVWIHLDTCPLQPPTRFLFPTQFRIQFRIPFQILFPTQFRIRSLLRGQAVLSASSEDIAEPTPIAFQETSAMCRVSTTVSVFQTRPRTAAPPRAASQTTATTATPRWTAAILVRLATTDNAYNRRLRTV